MGLLHVDQIYCNGAAFRCVFLNGLFEILLFYALQSEPTTHPLPKLDLNEFNYISDWPS